MADVLAVPAAHVGAGAVQVHKVAPGLLFNDRHGSALIHSTKGCADAGMAAAHDDHIIGACILVLVGVSRSLTQPVAGAAVAGHTAGHFGRLRLFHLSAGSLCDTVGYALLMAPTEATSVQLVTASTSALWPSTMALAMAVFLSSVSRSCSPEEVISQAVMLLASKVMETPISE